MKNLLKRWLIYSVIIYLTCWFLSGIRVDSFWTAIVVAAVLSAVNVFIKPFFFITTLPLTIVTLGLFYFVINALMLLIVSSLVSGFVVTSFGAALPGSLMISILCNLFL